MADRPNILLITSDQQHYSTLGSVNPTIRTPHLDRLAAEGARFDRAYCNNPVCSPSRSTMATGLYPAWHHCWTIGVKLPEDVPTVGDVFQRNGYSTALIGKAHFQPLASRPGSESLECQPTLRDLDFWRGFHGPWYGFEHVEVLRNHADESHVGQHYALWMEEKGLANWRDYFWKWPENQPRREHHWDLPEEFHYTNFVTERAIASIEASVAAEKPFFLWTSYPDPHPPYLVSEPWASMYDPDDMKPGILRPGEMELLPPHFRKTQEERPDFAYFQEEFGCHGAHSHLHSEEKLRKNMAIYYGMVSFMDDGIGRILDSLDRLGVAENTLVVFTTDHGHFLGQHGLIAKGPFHFEDMLRIPFVVRCPGQVEAGRVSDALQCQVDLPTTFLAASGIDVPGGMQGVDQLAVWRGETESAREWILCENRHQPSAVHLRTLVTDRYKITVYRQYEYGELFDLYEDPYERKNLWDSPEHQLLKSELLLRFLQAEMEREPTRMPRIAGA